MARIPGSVTGDVEMTTNEIILQAENFMRWHIRADGDLEANFRWWAQGKDFAPDDERAVWVLVQEIIAKRDLRVDASSGAVSAA